MTKTSIADWQIAARAALANRAEQPLQEAQLLLANELSMPRAWIMTHPEIELAPAQLSHLDEQVNRRAAGEPLPYLLGRWEFYGLELEVSPAVLIPRPETELLVDLGLDWLAQHPGPRLAADVGTGSGCIAAALAKYSPDLTICAVDLSAAALQVARRNFSRLGLVSRMRMVQGDLLSGLRGPFSLVCANLPYIPSRTLQELPDLSREPALALDGGPDGLRLIDILLRQAVSRLAPGGRMLLEIEISQECSAPHLARRYFPQAQVHLQTDLAGLPRIVIIDQKF